MRVLITGAAGYLGRRLQEELAGDFELTLADVAPQPAELPDGAVWRHCDITDEKAVRELVAGHDAVVHTVAIVRGHDSVPISTFRDVTVGGTWNVFDAAATSGVSRVVNISSIVVAGALPKEDGPIGTTGWGPFTTDERGFRYCLSKRLGEVIADSFAATFPELSVVNLRPVMIAGDGQNPEPVAPAEGGLWFIHVDVRDLARAVRRALEADPAPRGTYNVTAARPDSAFSWREAERDFGFVAEHNWSEIP